MLCSVTCQTPVPGVFGVEQDVTATWPPHPSSLGASGGNLCWMRLPPAAWPVFPSTAVIYKIFAASPRWQRLKRHGEHYSKLPSMWIICTKNLMYWYTTSSEHWGQKQYGAGENNECFICVSIVQPVPPSPVVQISARSQCRTELRCTRTFLTLLNCSSTCLRMLGGASYRRGSRAGR